MKKPILMPSVTCVICQCIVRPGERMTEIVRGIWDGNTIDFDDILQMHSICEEHNPDYDQSG